MATVVLFHHVRGLTDGVLALAGHFRAAGHTVHTPDLFDGELPGSIEEGIAFAESIDPDVGDRRMDEALEGIPDDVVFAGISMGGMHAQRLAQTRAGALGVLLYETCVPITGEWSFGPWPENLAVQVHGMEEDPFFAEGGDLDAARELVATVGPQRAELFTYPGNQHLFVDSSLPSHDPEAAALVVQRSLAFLDRLDAAG